MHSFSVPRSESTWDYYTNWIASGHQDLSVRYEPLCYYLGVCLPGYDLNQLIESDVEELVMWGMLNHDLVAIETNDA